MLGFGVALEGVLPRHGLATDAAGGGRLLKGGLL